MNEAQQHFTHSGWGWLGHCCCLPFSFGGFFFLQNRTILMNSPGDTDPWISRVWNFSGNILDDPSPAISLSNVNDIWALRWAQGGLLLSPFCQGICTISMELEEAVRVSMSGAGRAIQAFSRHCAKTVLFPWLHLCPWGAPWWGLEGTGCWKRGQCRRMKQRKPFP